ncbi:MAG TPA: hypothetical protein V6D29_15085 [Leptolyngbyaceae cyanobacterium]
MSHFWVHDLRKKGNRKDCNSVNDYLSRLHDRFNNAIHAETRVYTCHSWRSSGGKTAPHPLHWNDEEVPGETFLGSFGWVVGRELTEQIETEFAQGESVRLFIFNSDADLCFEEVLEPIQD